MTTRPVTLKHLAASLAEQHELTKRQGETLLNDLVGLITKHLKKGERIRIAGFGILQVRKRPARMGRNPATEWIGWGIVWVIVLAILFWPRRSG
jgi:DNA-binding protein HU-beta